MAAIVHYTDTERRVKNAPPEKRDLCRAQAYQGGEEGVVMDPPSCPGGNVAGPATKN